MSKSNAYGEHWGQVKHVKPRYDDLVRDVALLRNRVAEQDREIMQLREQLAEQEIRNRDLIGLQDATTSNSG